MRIQKWTGSTTFTIAKEVEEDVDEYLDEQEATKFRGLAARLNYLSQDRPDVKFASKLCSQLMARPTVKAMQLMKRVARYLKSKGASRVPHAVGLECRQCQ